MADATDLLQQPAPGQLGFGLPVEGNAPLPAPAFPKLEARQQRRDATSTMDVVRSVWRQDGLTDGLVASLAGRELTPDPAYNPFTDPGRPQLVEGILPEFHGEFDRAHSAAHAFYIRDRLLQKQMDLQVLEDLGLGGSVGRIALNVINPENVLMGLGAAGAARVFRGAELAMAARGAASPIAAAEAQAGVRAAQATAASKAPAVAVGVGFGAAENAAYEAFRQSVNFEDNGWQVLEAGLLGAALSAPFAWAGARSMRRVAETAHEEHAILQAVKAADEGTPLTPEQGQLIHRTHQKVEAIVDLVEGRITPDEFKTRTDAFVGPVEPPDVWMKRFGDRVRAEADDIIATMFPGSAGKATGRAAPSPAQRAQMDAAVALEDTNFAPPVRSAGEAPGNQLALALRKAMNDAKPREEDAAWAAWEKETRTSKSAAFRAAEAADEAKKAADYEAALRARELARMTAEDPDFLDRQGLAILNGPEKAPESPAKAPEPSLQGEGSQTPARAPQTAESFVGQTVTWMDAKTGDMNEGKVMRVSPTGKLVIEDEMGVLRAVDHTKLTEYVDEVPHGFIASGSIGAAQVRLIGDIVQGSTAGSSLTLPGTGGRVKVPTRFDLYNFLNQSENEVVRSLAFKLIKDPVGNKNGLAQDFTASEWRSHQVRLINGEFHRTSKEAFTAALQAAQIPIWRRRSFATDFYGAASVYTRVQDDRVLAKIPQAAWGNVKAVSASMRKALDRHLAEAKKAGVKGAADVQANDAYVNRIWRADRIREAVALHGEENVYRLLANAMTGTGPHGPLTGDVVKAEKFLKTVTALEFSPAMQNIHLAGRDMATLRDELRAMKLTDDQINTVVDTMFEVRESSGTDAGQASNLRFRFDLDESVELTTPAGRLTISDLLENDARILVDHYGRSMAGHTALARIGIPSQAAWAQQLQGVKQAAGLGNSRLAREVQWLEDIHANILGRPMSMADFTFTARSAAAFRGYTRSLLLGQLGLTAAFEMFQAIGMMGARSMMTQMPTFGGFIHALRRGHLPDAGLARDIMQITGWGQEKASAYARAREIDEGLAADLLTKFEKGANEASHAVDILSGNSSFTSLTKQFSSIMAAQQLHDFASGLKKLDGARKLRLAGQGLEGQWLDDVMAHLKEFSDSDSGVLKQIRHEDWKAADPETYERFQLFLSRQTRDAIQDQDLGETLPFMHSTLGKMFGELKTFFFVAHAKNLVKNLHYGDATTLQVMLITMMGQALAYSIQTAINTPDQLDEKLSPEAIGRAAMFRMAALGFLPMMVETGYNVASGGDSLVSPGTTANTDNRSFLKPPSLSTAGKLVRLPQTLAGAALGTDTTTSQEVRDAISLIPGANLYGARGLASWFAESFPNSDPSKVPSR